MESISITPLITLKDFIYGRKKFERRTGLDETSLPFLLPFPVTMGVQMIELEGLVGKIIM